MTLVETLVALAIFTILSLAVTSAIHSFYQYNAYTFAQSHQVSHARLGIESLVRDLREMTYADDGTFPLVYTGQTSISFYSDIDRDASVELVTYTLSSTTLYKYVYDATGNPPVYSTTTPDITYTISEYVQNGLQATPIFRYYDRNGAMSSSLASTDVRYVDVRLIINIDPVRDPGEFMLRSSASLRNLKENVQ